MNKYNIFDIVRTKIYYANDPRTEVEAIIYGIEVDSETGGIKYKIRFNANSYENTYCLGYVKETDVIELISSSNSIQFPIKVRCQFCGKEFVVKDTDVVKQLHYERTMYGIVDYGANCPICEKFTSIRQDAVPSKVIGMLPEAFHLS